MFRRQTLDADSRVINGLDTTEAILTAVVRAEDGDTLQQ
jgi:hypothetical protein